MSAFGGYLLLRQGPFNGPGSSGSCSSLCMFLADQGLWTFGEFQNTAKTWLTQVGVA